MQQHLSYKPSGAPGATRSILREHKVKTFLEHSTNSTRPPLPPRSSVLCMGNSFPSLTKNPVRNFGRPCSKDKNLIKNLKWCNIRNMFLCVSINAHSYNVECTYRVWTRRFNNFSLFGSFPIKVKVNRSIQTY